MVDLSDFLELFEELRLLLEFFLPPVFDGLCSLLHDSDDFRPLVDSLSLFFDIKHRFLSDTALNVHLLLLALLKRAGNCSLMPKRGLQFGAGRVFNHFKLQ